MGWFGLRAFSSRFSLKLLCLVAGLRFFRYLWFAWWFLVRAKTKRELRCKAGTVPAAVRPVQVSNKVPLLESDNGQTGRRSKWAKSEDLPL